MIGLLSALRLAPFGIKPKGEPAKKTQKGCPWRRKSRLCAVSGAHGGVVGAQDKAPSERRSQRELGDERVMSPAAVGGHGVSPRLMTDDSPGAKQGADVKLLN